jgi:hypothetical protein
MNKQIACLAIIVVLFSTVSCQKGSPDEKADDRPEKLRALIVDGQNNHGIWPKTTVMMKSYLEETGLFTVDVARTMFTWQGPHNDNDEGFGEQQRLQLMQNFPVKGDSGTRKVSEPTYSPNYAPDFSNYDVVISNFGWKAAPWPKQTQDAFEKFMREGGGLVVIHAGDNSFPEWIGFNRMIGMGAWGDRTEKDGPYVYYNNENQLVRDTVKGPAGSHGKQYEFKIIIRDTTHAITRGMPAEWLHVQDEMYDRLRGPAENMNVLATAYSDEEKNDSPFSDLRGTNRHEPMMIAVKYGEGRIFHTPLGHTDYSMECVGFITMLQRGTEWAATGNVTQSTLPSDFPTAEKTSKRPWQKK